MIGNFYSNSFFLLLCSSLLKKKKAMQNLLYMTLLIYTFIICQTWCNLFQNFRAFEIHICLLELILWRTITQLALTKLWANRSQQDCHMSRCFHAHCYFQHFQGWRQPFRLLIIVGSGFCQDELFSPQFQMNLNSQLVFTLRLLKNRFLCVHTIIIPVVGGRDRHISWLILCEHCFRGKKNSESTVGRRQMGKRIAF